MRDQPTIRGQRINSAPSYQERYYRYNGDEPFAPPVKFDKADAVCAAGDCAGAVHAKGLCGAHYRKHRLGIPLDADGRQRPFDPSFCGTVSGYKRHDHHDVPLCQPCREAKNAYDRARRAGTTRKKEAA